MSDAAGAGSGQGDDWYYCMVMGLPCFFNASQNCTNSGAYPGYQSFKSVPGPGVTHCEFLTQEEEKRCTESAAYPPQHCGTQYHWINRDCVPDDDPDLITLIYVNVATNPSDECDL